MLSCPVAALQSVFPPSELATFMTLLRRDKEQQLNELAMIVTGIRLFNKDGAKGGESIEDRESRKYLSVRIAGFPLILSTILLVPAILNKLLPATSRDIESELEGTRRLAWRYTALLERRTGPDHSDVLINPDLILQALYNVRQHEAFLKLLLVSINAGAIQKIRLFVYGLFIYDYLLLFNIVNVLHFS